VIGIGRLDVQVHRGDRVEGFVADGSDPAELDRLLNECVADGTLEGLACAPSCRSGGAGGGRPCHPDRLGDAGASAPLGRVLINAQMSGFGDEAEILCSTRALSVRSSEAGPRDGSVV